MTRGLLPASDGQLAAYELSGRAGPLADPDEVARRLQPMLRLAGIG